MNYILCDTHPDKVTPAVGAAQCRLLNEEIQSDSANNLILPGDNFGSLLEGTWDMLRNNATFLRWCAAIRELSQTNNVYIIGGNHDPQTDKDWPKVKALLGERVHCVGEVLDGALVGLNGWLFMHGHQPQFDITTQWWEFLLALGNGSIGESKTAALAKWLIDLAIGRKPTPTPQEFSKLVAGTKDAGAKLNAYVALMHDKHFRYVYESPTTRVLVCGHTHRTEMRESIAGSDMKTLLNPGAFEQLWYAQVDDDENITLGRHD